MTGGRSRFVVACAICGAGLLAAQAGAGTLGGGLGGNPQPSSCSGTNNPSCTIFNVTLPGGTTVARKAGVITSWRVRAATGRVRLVVIAGGPGARRVVGGSSFQTASGTSTQTFKSHVPIKTGQLIGLELADGAQVAISYDPGATIERFLPPLGSSARGADYDGPAGYAIGLSATEKATKKRHRR